MKFCKDCGEEKENKEFYGNNAACKVCYQEKYKNRNTNWIDKPENKKRKKEKNAEWFQNNKEHKYNYVKNRKKEDPIFKASFDLRNMLWRLINKKHTPTFQILGYTPDIFNSRFGSDILYFNENNIKYNIDHKIPMDWFKDDTPPSVICHLDNLQIIDANLNFSKNSRYCHPIIKSYADLILPFVKDCYKLLIQVI